MIYTVLYILIRMMSYIPFSFGQFLGNVLGRALYMILQKRKNIALDNIRKSSINLDIAEAKKLTRMIFIHFGQMLFEVPHLYRLNHQNLDRYVSFRNEETLFKAMEKEKGVFILSAHFGNWELMASALNLRFGKISVVMRPSEIFPLDKLVSDLRARSGVELIFRKGAVRKMLTNIKQKKVVGLMMDQSAIWLEGVFVNFMGRLSYSNKALAIMALKTGAPIIPVFPLKQKDGRYLIHIDNEVELIWTGDQTKDVEENTARFNEIIEKYIKRYPDHWLWFQRRWKIPPYSKLPDSSYIS